MVTYYLAMTGLAPDTLGRILSSGLLEIGRMANQALPGFSQSQPAILEYFVVERMGMRTVGPMFSHIEMTFLTIFCQDVLRFIGRLIILVDRLI